MPTVVFWKSRPEVPLKPAAVYQELQFGEDVAGLIDLPVKDFLTEIKTAFPNHHETPGALVAFGATGKFELSWTWQFVAAKMQDLVSVDVERLKEIFVTHGCGVYEVELDQWSPPNAAY